MDIGKRKRVIFVEPLDVPIERDEPLDPGGPVEPEAPSGPDHPVEPEAPIEEPAVPPKRNPAPARK